MLPLRNFAYSFFRMIRYLPSDFDKAVLRNKTYLSGVHAEDVYSVLPEFYERYLRPRLFLGLQERMNGLRAEGYTILLVSGTLHFIVDLLVERLGTDGGVGSVLEVRDGRFTGYVLGIHPFHHDKVKALQKYLDGREVDYDRSFAFGDSWADVPLLSLFGYPVAVNPGLRLRHIAKKKKWKIEVFSG